MKNTLLTLLAISLVACKNQDAMTNETFTSERVARTAAFELNEAVDVVFPLFGAFEERKWEPDWNPQLIYPAEEVIEEGTTFKIDAHGHGTESEYIWVVSKYVPEDYLIQYLVYTENRHWTITVDCESINGDTRTKATVTYSFTGLNNKGNELNARALSKMYENNLQDWAEALERYFKTQ